MQSLVNLNANMAGIFLGNDLYTMNMDDRHHRTLFNMDDRHHRTLFNIGTKGYMIKKKHFLRTYKQNCLKPNIA